MLEKGVAFSSSVIEGFTVLAENCFESWRWSLHDREKDVGTKLAMQYECKRSHNICSLKWLHRLA